MSEHEIVAELRRFILSFGEHDPDCLGVDATVWEQQLQVCQCGFAPRLDQLLAQLATVLAGRPNDNA
jgi:hypothetical protein